MSNDLKGLSCVRCRSYLFEDDDVVFCPHCGAPHHRDCYAAIGHCALEELHGTPEEYSREKVIKADIKAEKEEKTEQSNNTVKCEMCSAQYDVSLNRCPKCNAPNFTKISGFSGFDFLGGVPADYDLGEGVTANEAKNFVASNTHRYIPKFAILNRKHKISWNWMAFLFPSGWMLSRKMYKGGLIAALATILATCLSYPLTKQLYSVGVTGSQYLAENLNSILPEIGGMVFLLAVIGTFFDLGIRVFSALFGDYIYKNHSIITIKKIKETSEDKLADYRKKGGMSMLLFLLGIMLVQYGSVIITMFL